MEFFKGYGNYDKNPVKQIKGFDNQSFSGYGSTKKEIKRLISKGNRVFVFDFYFGVDKEEVEKFLKKLNPNVLIDVEETALSGEELNEKFKENITEDRVFGAMTLKNMMDCYDRKKLEKLQKKADSEKGIVFVYGSGARLVTKGDVFFYFDLARWEIQQRYRDGMPNWRCENFDEASLGKVKRGYFFEWKVADRHKKKYFDEIDYLVDTNIKEAPKMITGTAFREGLRQLSSQPFRLRPFFDSGIWGGQWMKNVCGLDKERENFAWCFDGVPSENSILLGYGDVIIEIPGTDLVMNRPFEFLGDKVYGRFGREFPIRFNMLDLMGGGNLSLQVHPVTEYVQEVFGAHFTQDESYYLLDAEDDACVYLGVKDGTDKEKFKENLLRAEMGDRPFDTDKFINKFPVKKHDHISIPGGTIHSSGANTMVLEISSTPNIYTFKLWDWGRIDSDGFPRPIHTKHGLSNIQWERDTSWIKNSLLNQSALVYEDDDIKIERTGLHHREFIETHRYTFSKEYVFETGDTVNILNLVEGAEIELSCPYNKFKPMIIHYVETVMIPASVSKIIMRPVGESKGKSVKVISAKVR